MEANVYWIWLFSMGSLIFLMQGAFFLLVVLIVVTKTTGLRISRKEKAQEPGLSVQGMPPHPQLGAEPNMRIAPLHVLSAVRVAEVMKDVLAVSPKDSLEAIQEIMFAREVFALPVLDEDCELCGIISMADIIKIDRSERSNVTAAAVYSRHVQSAFPDQTVHEVVERMRERHLANFPVVSRRDEKQVVGMISKSDIVLAYQQIAVQQAV